MGFYKDGKWQPDATEIASGEFGNEEYFNKIKEERENKEVERLNRRIKALEDHRDFLKQQLVNLWKRQPERAERVKRGCLDIVATNCGPCPACGGYNE